MQCLRDYIFLPLSYVFALKLRESLLKSLKITLKKMVDPYWGAGKLFSFTQKLFLKEITNSKQNAIARTAHADVNNNTQLFSLTIG